MKRLIATLVVLLLVSASPAFAIIKTGTITADNIAAKRLFLWEEREETLWIVDDDLANRVFIHSGVYQLRHEVMED